MQFIYPPLEPNIQIPKSPKIHHLDGMLWPSSMEYLSQVNPIFLHQLEKLDLFASAPTWLIRDGLVPIIWFFKRNPKPSKAWKSRLIIHTNFTDFVPPPWRPFVGSYRLKTKSSSRPGENQILLLGLVTGLYCSLAALKEQLDAIVNTIKSENLKRIKISALLTAKFSPYEDLRRENYHMEYVVNVFERFGSGIKVLNWPEFMMTDNFFNTDVVDLNDQRVCADNALVHRALSYGGAPFPYRKGRNRTQFSNPEYYPLSHYHGFEINKQIDEIPADGEKWKSIEEFLKFEGALKLKKNEAKDSNVFQWPEALLRWAQTEV